MTDVLLLQLPVPRLNYGVQTGNIPLGAACLKQAGAIFKISPSPYIQKLLEPQIENMMLLETQRGCPYRCGYCYYNKSHKGVSFADEALLLRGIRLAIISEIRAEAIDTELADLFAAAGFSWFEIGLQSTNPRALQIMNRPTHTKRFAQGAKLLKQRGIVPAIDLIVGLPGDDLQGFSRSVYAL